MIWSGMLFPTADAAVAQSAEPGAHGSHWLVLSMLWIRCKQRV